MSDPTENPYAAPQSEIATAAPDDGTPVPASAGLRLGNLIIDQVVQIGLSFVSGYVLLWIGDEAAVSWLYTIPDLVFGVVLGLIYYCVFEASCGRTPGKWITGTKVVNADGSKVTFGRVLARSACRFIPFEAFTFLGTNTRGLHDSIPKTYVVKVR